MEKIIQKCGHAIVNVGATVIQNYRNYVYQTTGILANEQENTVRYQKYSVFLVFSQVI